MDLNLELMTWLIPVFPVLAFGIIVLFTNRWNGLSHWVAIVAILTSFVFGMIVIGNALDTGAHDL